MEKYREQVFEIVKDRDARTLWRNIKQIPAIEIISELNKQRCSVLGTPQVLKERLIRLEIKLKRPELFNVPWFEDYDGSDAKRVLVYEVFSHLSDDSSRTETLDKEKKIKRSKRGVDLLPVVTEGVSLLVDLGDENANAQLPHEEEFL